MTLTPFHSTHTRIVTQNQRIFSWKWFNQRQYRFTKCAVECASKEEIKFYLFIHLRRKKKSIYLNLQKVPRVITALWKPSILHDAKQLIRIPLSNLPNFVASLPCSPHARFLFTSWKSLANSSKHSNWITKKLIKKWGMREIFDQKQITNNTWLLEK